MLDFGLSMGLVVVSTSNGVIFLIFNFNLFLTFTQNFTPTRGVPHDFYSALSLCNANETTLSWDVTCCDSNAYDRGGCGCALINIFISLDFSTNVGSCSLGNTTGTL